jgi:Protein phosphatase 2C
LASHTVGSVAVLALLYKPKQPSLQSAPTAQAAATTVSSKTTVYVASVGDCRCVLSRGGQAIAVTDDHKVCASNSTIVLVVRLNSTVVNYWTVRYDGTSSHHDVIVLYAHTMYTAITQR